MAEPVKIEDSTSKANRHTGYMCLLLATLCGEKKWGSLSLSNIFKVTSVLRQDQILEPNIKSKTFPHYSCDLSFPNNLDWKLLNDKGNWFCY